MDRKTYPTEHFTDVIATNKTISNTSPYDLKDKTC